MRAVLSYAWRTLLCAVAAVAGTLVGAAATAGLGAALPAVPPPRDPGTVAGFGLLAAFALAAGLVPLASGLAVRFAARWAALALFAFVCAGLNTAIEAAIFTSLGGTAGLLVLNAILAGVLGAALAASFRARGELQAWPARARDFAARRRAGEWILRAAIAVLAFPVIYLAFGSMIAPIVVPAYQAAQFGLVLPGYGVIVPVQLVRSALYLAASAPLLVAWRGSRLRLALALAAAHFVLDGLSGMLQAYWLPAPIRLAHSVEILGDSLVYAAVVVALLVPAREEETAGRAEVGAAPPVRAAG